MEEKQYEQVEDFNNRSAFHMLTGYADRSYKKHWHTYGQIIMVGSGDVNVFKVNQNTYQLSGGDVVLAWPMEMHEIVDANRNDALVIQFGNAFMHSLYDLQRVMHFYHDLHVIRHEEHPELAKRLSSITDRMKEIFFSQSADREIRCCLLLMDFMLALDEHRDEFSSELRQEGKSNLENNVVKRLIMVTDYVKNNLTADDLSQGAVAEKAGISKDYFSRIFKNVMGMNYSKWVNMIRIERATELLSQKDMPLAEVALLAGFKSLSSFNRVFRKEKGMAPGEYQTYAK